MMSKGKLEIDFRKEGWVERKERNDNLHFS